MKPITTLGAYLRADALIRRLHKQLESLSASGDVGGTVDEECNMIRRYLGMEELV